MRHWNRNFEWAGLVTRLEFDNPVVDHPALQRFASLAEDFCSLVEHRSRMPASAFLHTLHRLLPSLYAAGIDLPPLDVLYNDEDDSEDEDEPTPLLPPDPDHISSDDRISLHRTLEAFLGEHHFYREVFDPFKSLEEEPEVVGSLADDVADIYGDLHCGLQKWRRDESGAALWEWRFGLEHHWGEHATGAIRALHTRAAWWDSGWPPS